jgi:hypothetical protein
MWTRSEDQLPKEGEYVAAYRDSPADAEVMLFQDGVFVDMHGMVWKAVAWRPPRTPQ